ncbi:hypothetical protein Tco_0329378 [Tanacetum coccineum]
MRTVQRSSQQVTNEEIGDLVFLEFHVNLRGITTCNALGRSWCSINLIPYSGMEQIYLFLELTPTCIDIRIGTFRINKIRSTPEVPLILGRCFLKTSHALIDVYEGEITLRVGKEAITFNLDQTSRYTSDYNHMTGFSNVIASGNPTPYFEPIVSTASPNLTPFGDSDFLLFEEADSFLALEDDPTHLKLIQINRIPEGDHHASRSNLNSGTPPPLHKAEQLSALGV